MSGRLIFLDIDGTLTLPGRNTPPESALTAIRKARERGHRVFLCTGRNRAMLSALLSLGCFDGAVASDGGYVFCGDRLLFDCPMRPEQTALALRLLKEGGVYRTLEARDASYCDEGTAAFLGRISHGNSELLRWREALERDLGIRPMAEYDGRPVYKIVFMCADLRQLEAARAQLEEDFLFCVQEPDFPGLVNGELISRLFDKGRGVKRMCEALGVDVRDTVGFGDGLNDLEMIETVGQSVCMANGSPRLREKSDLVCPAVDKDGLAWGFEALGLV